jgi:hypothetical protein
VSVAGGTFTDADGNGNTVSNTLSIAYDTVAPTITVCPSGSGTLYQDQSDLLTFTLSESSSNFAFGDVTVSGGELSSFAGSGRRYTATFTPTANYTGTASVSVAGGTFTDAAGNDNLVSNSLCITIDTNSTPPTTTTLPPVVTVPVSVPTTTIPSLVVPRSLGTEVKNLPPVPARVAEKTAIAVRNGTLTVLIDPPNLPKVRAVDKYVITLTPTGGGRSVTWTVKVKTNSQVLMQKFTGLKGGYRVSIIAQNRKGASVGAWKSSRINIRG